MATTILTTVKERPILFSGAMVRAILGGTKTQTRRVFKYRGMPEDEQPHHICQDGGGNWVAWYGAPSPNPTFDWDAFTKRAYREGEGLPCPYGQPGERLWVRETWGTDARLNGTPPNALFSVEGGNPIYYRADEAQPERLDTWRPSIHMPRAACRLLLEIVAVRVERLQSISCDDAVAEGIERIPHPHPPFGTSWKNYLDAESHCPAVVDSYSTLWKSLNGPDSWAANPWVWVVEFKVIDGKEVARG